MRNDATIMILSIVIVILLLSSSVSIQHTCTCIHTQTYTYTDIHRHTYIHSYMYIHRHIQYMYTYTDIHVHVFMYIHNKYHRIRGNIDSFIKACNIPSNLIHTIETHYSSYRYCFEVFIPFELLAINRYMYQIDIQV